MHRAMNILRSLAIRRVVCIGLRMSIKRSAPTSGTRSNEEIEPDLEQSDYAVLLIHSGVDGASCFVHCPKPPMIPHPTAPPAHVPAAWRYGGTAVTLHWVIALLLPAMAALGWYMMSIEEEPGSGWYFELHKSIGLVVALLVAVRIAWRLTHRPQPLPTTVPGWQVRLSQVTQALLYALMVFMPVTGYLGASYSKVGVKFFGANTPRWALPDHDLAEQFFGVHSTLVWVLVALIGVHVAGALHHLLRRKDGVFQRMTFGRGKHDDNRLAGESDGAM